MHKEIKSLFESHCHAIREAEQSLSARMATVVDLLTEALGHGRKLLIMGNGGSAADAQHFAAEIVGRFKLERRALPAISLTTDSSILTAVGNDYGFDTVFSRQVEALAQPGDIVFGISTSGSSPNVLNALLLARDTGCRTIGLLGGTGGKIAGIVDVPLVVPVRDTPRVQEAHVTIIHILCELVEKRLFGKNGEL